MNDKARVRITLESDIDGTKERNYFTGDWYRKDSTIFIRYEEDDETYGNVRTLVRWREGELKVKRQGGVEAEQMFVAGRRLNGSYTSAHARFPLETETSLLWMQSGDFTDRGMVEEVPRPTLPMMLEWRYVLWIGEESVGQFKLRLFAETMKEQEA
ncbi:uncharacterized beta-barrel protein YwiB (DUF1934 family) [Paenibacillus phyllosphaerae]|uniref:Uncharacterized beta-barrel protein YwiB (DUF1934 family) n=1 Tax=Paenibacillus phyllosphaerae TaxID=274593 RepID=A0A7W5FRR9_9BACL|nr:DUF1934 domain-containing protein [Paenibacillus phyllosphaerae]MBB3114658.1 uncharacterized beta-barrel protein YwiB (DUF1934 family) [Paenibacillus phyllosphaerae]